MLTVSTGLSVPEMTGVIDIILAGCAVPIIGLSKPVGRSRISVLIWSISSGGGGGGDIGFGIIYDFNKTFTTAIV